MELNPCRICLSDIKLKDLLIPEVPCKCAFAVHFDCWKEWLIVKQYSQCIYCRQLPIRVFAFLRDGERDQEYLQFINTFCSFLIGFILFILIIYLHL